MPILGVIASSQATSAPGAYESISTTSVGSPTVPITFSSIPSTFQHLQIRFIARGTLGTAQVQINMRFNSDSANNYTNHLVRADGASAFADGSNTPGNRFNGVARIAAATAASGMVGNGIIDIYDYAKTNKFKTMRALGGTDQDGTGQIYYKSGSYMSTSAISTITIDIDDGGSFAQYLHFALYGIKGA